MIPGALYLLRAFGCDVVVTVERVYRDGSVQVSHAGPEWTWAGLVTPAELRAI